jgi:PTH1 family peptidyl-tRNA hydrolase
MSEIKMIVGLGNPGQEYVGTRHNIGFAAIDLLAERLKTEVKKKRFGAVFGRSEFSDKKLILFKPWLFMNNSGQAVAAAANFYKLAPASDLLVIADDMALEPGRIRLRKKGSAGGHKGLADIIEKLGTDEFCRLRIGIGQCSEDSAVDFVLDRPAKEEKPLLTDAIERSQDAVICWIEEGIDAAMNRYNN